MEGQNQVKNEPGRTIGFDCHPDTFTAAAVTGNDPLNAEVQWIDHKLPVGQLEKWLAKRTTPQDRIVIEASGNTFNVVKRIQAAGRTALILESFKASRVKKSYCSTDKTSAVLLARVFLSGLAPIVWMPDEKTLQRRELFHAHKRAVTDRTRANNRISSFLNQQGLRSLCKLNYLQSDSPSIVLKAKDWTETQKALISYMFMDLTQAHEKRKTLRVLMAMDILNDKQVIKLVRIFGIRHITAFALAAIIGDINRFSNPKQLVAYVGLNPNTNQSGKKDRSSGMSRHGRRDLRSLLVESAHTVFNHSHNPLHKWAWKLKYRKGGNTAVIAVARKIIVACWYLLKGFFTKLTEVPATMMLKIDKLASEIGAKTIKSWGYKYAKDFKEEKYQFLLESS